MTVEQKNEVFRRDIETNYTKGINESDNNNHCHQCGGSIGPQCQQYSNTYNVTLHITCLTKFIDSILKVHKS